jgi:hypothetical protein
LTKTLDETIHTTYDYKMNERYTHWVETNGDTSAPVQPDNDNIAVDIGFQIDGDGNVTAHAFRADRVAVLNADSTIQLPLAVAERFAGGTVTWHATSDTTWTLRQPELSVEYLDELGPAEHLELPTTASALDDESRALVERLRRHQ